MPPLALLLPDTGCDGSCAAFSVHERPYLRAHAAYKRQQCQGHEGTAMHTHTTPTHVANPIRSLLAGAPAPIHRSTAADTVSFASQPVHGNSGVCGATEYSQLPCRS